MIGIAWWNILTISIKYIMKLIFYDIDEKVLKKKMYIIFTKKKSNENVNRTK